MVDQPKFYLRQVSVKTPASEKEKSRLHNFDEDLIKAGIKIIPIDKIEKSELILGKGKFGKVYSGCFGDKRVAIKKIKLGIEDDADENVVIEDIINEIKTLELANTLCSEVPKFYGVWKGLKGVYYHLIFEFIEGMTLRAKLNENKLLLEEKLLIICQISKVLDFLHAKKLIHRDVKPENIMILEINSKFQIKLIDFGTAKIATNTITHTSSIIGTVYYMSPDNFDFSDENPEEEHPVSHTTKVDVWSLGVMITEILTGIFPYSNITRCESAIESLLVQSKPFPIPKELNQRHPELLPIVNKCLEIDRNLRCTCRDVFNFIRPFISDDLE